VGSHLVQFRQGLQPAPQPFGEYPAHARALTAQTAIDVFLSNHSEWDGSIEKMKGIRAGNASGSNPFVVGPQAVNRALQVMDECARAQADRFGFP
jgi:hypothetical protein